MKHYPSFVSRCAVLLGMLLAAPAWSDDTVTLGLAKVATRPRATVFGEQAAQPPAAPFRSAAMLAQALPSNQWYSSVMFRQWSEPIHAHPASYRAGPDGFEIDYPVQSLIPAGARGSDIGYQHHAALTVSPAGFTPADARLDAIGDFSARIVMGDAAAHTLKATLVHGSPFSYYELSDGDAKLHLGQGFAACKTQSAENWLCVTIAERSYAVFAPASAHWINRNSSDPSIQFAASERYFSVAVLPDASQETLTEMARHAYAFVTGSHVDWHFDEAHSKVVTRFSVDTKAMEQNQHDALLGLYTHQYRALVAQPVLPMRYQSVRGPIQVIAGNSFQTEYTYHGILPFWGGLTDSEDRARLAGMLDGDAARARNLYSNQLGNGTYWYGKALSATAQLMCVAEQEGNSGMRDSLLKSLREHLEAWFRGDGINGYFVRNASAGTVLGYPEEYGSIQHLNDHHFHYGYWLNAAAQVAQWWS